MKSEYEQILTDTKSELSGIRTWINEGKNKFDSKTKYLVSYAVIKASGTIEVVFKSVIYDVLAKGACEEARLYLERMVLDSSCNPNTGNISNMLQNISSRWRMEFDENVKISGCKDKINSLVQLRNDFAHGDSISVSIETVITYFDASISVLKILDNVIQSN